MELSGGINFSHSLLKLAEDGNPYANYELAIKEYRGEFSGTPRYDMAYQYFLKSASNHHPSAYWMLGNMIMNNLIGSSNEFDAKMAFNYFAKAMELGNIAAINSIGKCYKLGYGVKKDIETDNKYFFKAAEKNYSYALNNLAKLYEEEGNLKKAYECYLKSANLKESYANNKMGEFERLKGNSKVAFNFYKEAINTSINELYSNLKIVLLSMILYRSVFNVFFINNIVDIDITNDKILIIEFSMLNNFLIFFLLAPRLLNIPISLILSNTLVFVITLIRIIDTSKDMNENITNIAVIIFIKSFTMLIASFIASSYISSLLFLLYSSNLFITFSLSFMLSTYIFIVLGIVLYPRNDRLSSIERLFPSML